MPSVQYFEIPVVDVNRAQEFYKKGFGWDMQKWSNPENSENEYWTFETKDDEGNKGLNGGMMQRQTPQHTVTNYITISSIDVYSSKMEQTGGKMIVSKTNVSGMGFITVFLDSEQNMFEIFERMNFNNE
jgi:uncharacterized protein